MMIGFIVRDKKKPNIKATMGIIYFILSSSSNRPLDDDWNWGGGGAIM